MARRSERRWGVGGPQVIAAAQDAAWARAEAEQPPCTEDGESVEPCRFAGEIMHVCSDIYGGRVRPGTLCAAEARARLYERQDDLAGAVGGVDEEEPQWWRLPLVYCADCSHPWAHAAGVGHYPDGFGCLVCGCTKAPPTAEDAAALADLRADAEEVVRSADS